MKNSALLCLLLLIFVVSACSSLGINESRIDEVKVSFFKDFGSLNEDYKMVFQEKEQIEAFVEAINTSKRISGSEDLPEADYDLQLIFDEDTSEGFHLWISEEYSIGAIINIADTAIAYKLTEDSTDKIREILLD